MSDDSTLAASQQNVFSLPIFLTKQNKYFYSALWVLIGGSLYMLSNHFPIFPPRLLPMTDLDRAIPFIPQSIWIYSSEMFLFFSVYIISKDLVNANKYLYSFLALQLVSVAIFFLWPTTYPREQFPTPLDLDRWSAALFNNLRDVDTPGNCLPSLHVSSVYLSSFVYLDEQKKKFPFFFIWATLIAITTLTMKQHYVADVVSGFGIAVVMYFIFHRVVKYRTD